MYSKWGFFFSVFFILKISKILTKLVKFTLELFFIKTFSQKNSPSFFSFFFKQIILSKTKALIQRGEIYKELRIPPPLGYLCF